MNLHLEKLRNMVRDMCNEAGMEKKSNRSLRATGATQMFASNVPEKIIQSRTGHRSLQAHRLYERPSDEQHQAVSNYILTSSDKKQFQVEACKRVTYEYEPSMAAATSREGIDPFAPLVAFLQEEPIGNSRVNSNFAVGCGLSSLFNNCTTNIQNFVVNVNPNTIC